jgi:hypothetical protein
LQIASDVVNIFIPQEASPCQEKILYLQREDPILDVRNRIYAGRLDAINESPRIEETSIEWGLTAAQLGCRALTGSG